MPHRFVGMWDGYYGLYCQPGTPSRAVPLDGHTSYLTAWLSDSETTDEVWTRGPVLRFMRPGERHALEILWDPDWTHVAWYINLQAPLTVTGSFLDTCDHALDVWIDPDGRWQWKDEQDLVEAIALGIVDRDDAPLLRAEAERVIAARPWPTGWEDWRPPASWTPPSLSPRWNEAPAGVDPGC